VLLFLRKENSLMALPVVQRVAKQYKTKENISPFQVWLLNLGDAKAQAKITKAITQMEAGNFGDNKPIADGKGLRERRIDYGPGYRIFYTKDGDEFIVIFAGSDKAKQQHAIDEAKGYLADYYSRKIKETSSSHGANHGGKRGKRKK
jgi:putative addiction module killer protein